MKKLLILAVLTAFSVLALSSCSTDFSGVIDDKSNQIYEAIRDVAEPFLKEDPSYNEEETNENIEENEENTNEN